MRKNDVDPQPHQFGSDLSQAFFKSLRPPNLYRDVSTIDPTKFAQSLHEGGEPLAVRRRRCRTQEPDFGSLPTCCARAASGHAAAPPSSVMNSRRLMGFSKGPTMEI